MRERLVTLLGGENYIVAKVRKQENLAKRNAQRPIINVIDLSKSWRKFLKSLRNRTAQKYNIDNIYSNKKDQDHSFGH